jgi:hypothetical protein
MAWKKLEAKYKLATYYFLATYLEVAVDGVCCRDEGV